MSCCNLTRIKLLRPNDAYMRRQNANHHRFRWWLGAWSAPSHHLNQWWNVVNWNLRNKLQWNLKRKSYIFIQENTFENVVCKIVATSLSLTVLKGAKTVAPVISVMCHTSLISIGLVTRQLLLFATVSYSTLWWFAVHCGQAWSIKNIYSVML